MADCLNQQFLCWYMVTARLATSEPSVQIHIKAMPTLSNIFSKIRQAAGMSQSSGHVLKWATAGQRNWARAINFAAAGVWPVDARALASNTWLPPDEDLATCAAPDSSAHQQCHENKGHMCWDQCMCMTAFRFCYQALAWCLMCISSQAIQDCMRSFAAGIYSRVLYTEIHTSSCWSIRGLSYLAAQGQCSWSLIPITTCIRA